MTTREPVPLNRYWVFFMARGESPTGHAYVAWVREDPERLQTTRTCYGLYPDENLKRVILGPVRGRFSDVDCRGAADGDISLMTEVDPETYNRSFDVYEEWNREMTADEKQYHLIYSNCVLFVKEVALSIGLQTPGGLFSFPQHFISALIEINSPDDRPPEQQAS